MQQRCIILFRVIVAVVGTHLQSASKELLQYFEIVHWDVAVWF